MSFCDLNFLSDKYKIETDLLNAYYKKGLVRGFVDGKILKIDENSLKNTLVNKKKLKFLGSSKRSKYNAIELFSGCGGLALGLERSGFNTLKAFDIDPDSINTIKSNRPDWGAEVKDVKELSLKEYRGVLDLLAGGFPCQAFSYAGAKLGFADTRGTLYFEFLRLIKEAKPKIFLAENVKGLLSHDNGRTIKVMIEGFKKAGYRVEFKLLKSQFFDVPQKRERVIIVGVRKDLKIKYFFPAENSYFIPLREALSNITESEGITYSSAKEKVLAKVPEGGNWRDLPTALQKSYMGKSFNQGGGKTGVARRLHMDEPSLTLTCSPSQKQTDRCHPIETRPLNVREYARIQTFPDSWKFSGSTSSKYRQIGNAVPVNLAFHVGRSIIHALDSEEI